MSAENAALALRVRDCAEMYLYDGDHDIPVDAEAYNALHDAADALEQTETLLAQVRRSADEWWSLYDGELKKSEAAASDQQRRDADLLDEWAADGHYTHSSPTRTRALQRAADRLRTLADGQGRG